MTDYTPTPTFSEIMAAEEDEWRDLARLADADLAYCERARARIEAQADEPDKPKRKRRRPQASRTPRRRDRVTLPGGELGQAMAEAIDRVNEKDEGDSDE